MFANLGRLTSRHPWGFLVCALLVTLLSAYYGRDLVQNLSLAPGWDVPDSGSYRARQDLSRHLGRDETAVFMLFRPGPQGPRNVDDHAFRDEVESVLARVAQGPRVLGIDSYYSSADASLRSTGGDKTFAVVRLKQGDDEGLSGYLRLRNDIAGSRLIVELGGEVATYSDASVQLERDVRKAEVVSLLFLAMLLFWVFGSLVAAVLPLLVGIITVVLSGALLKFFSQFTEITVYTANVVSMLGLGLAIDYALFIVSRYREELASGLDPTTIARNTLATAGRTVVFSAMTVAGSMLCLYLLPQRFFHNMGLAGSISVGTAMLAATLVLPPLMVLLGRRLNSLTLPFLRRRLHASGTRGLWSSFSHWVMRHARLVLLGTLLLLAFMGLPMRHLEIGPADSKSLPPGTESRLVQETLEKEFPQARLSSLVLVVHTQGPARADPALSGLFRLSEQVRSLPGVVSVAGLAAVETGFSLEDYRLLYTYPEQFPLASTALQAYASGDHSLIVVSYGHAATSPEARDLVRTVRALPLPEGLRSLAVGGFPAANLDYVDSLKRHVPWVFAAIFVVVYVLLFLMLGSVILPIKAVLTSFLSLSATFGGLVWIFQDGNLSGLLGFTPQGRMEGTVLVLIFASAFGLSVDYEVFLLSRVKEMCVATRDNIASIASGIQRSGPIITSAALLIGIVLGTFAMGEVVFMKAMGLGLLISVIVDATLVRILLVPASLRLLGRLNWWAPRPLRKIYERFNLDECGPHRGKRLDIRIVAAAEPSRREPAGEDAKIRR